VRRGLVEVAGWWPGRERNGARTGGKSEEEQADRGGLRKRGVKASVVRVASSDGAEYWDAVSLDGL